MNNQKIEIEEILEPYLLNFKKEDIDIIKILAEDIYESGYFKGYKNGWIGYRENLERKLPL